ncbi:Polyubiqutin 4 [Pilaira anomala]|nr:Polyubiqutin 4 [Pilaira anomala]
MIIYVKTDNNDSGIPLTVVSSNTVAEVKKKVNTELGIPTSGHFFLFGGKTLQDKSTLGDYNIKGDSALHLVTRTIGGGMQLFVKGLSSTNTVVHVGDDCTLAGLKKAIQEKTGIPADYRLLFGGKQLDGENVKLKDFNIVSESALFTVYRLLGGYGNISLEI